MKKILICGVILTTALTSVVHFYGGQENNNNQKSRIIKTAIEKTGSIKEEIIIGIDNFSTVGGSAIVVKEAVKDIGDTLDIIYETEKYTNTTVNMRQDKSTNSPIITALNPNIMVKQYCIYDDWSYISIDEDTYGYVKSEYLSDEKTSISKLNRWGIELTDDEIELLAKVVFRESNLESYEGQVAVVETVFNRIVSGYWGDTLYDVLSAKGQFSCWDTVSTAIPTSKNYKAVYDVLYGKTNMLSMDYLYFSRGGHASHNEMIKIGNHQFCTKG